MPENGLAEFLKSWNSRLGNKEQSISRNFASSKKPGAMANVSSPKIKKMSPQLLVADIGHAIEFYTKKLSFDLDFRYQDFYAGIVRDGFSIHLKSGNLSTEQKKIKRENENLDILLSVEGLEDLYNEFVNNSVEITQPLRKQPYGKEFYIADPDGNILGFVEV